VRVHASAVQGCYGPKLGEANAQKQCGPGESEAPPLPIALEHVAEHRHGREPTQRNRPGSAVPRSILRAGGEPSDQDLEAVEQIHAVRTVAGDAANLSDQLHRLLAEGPRVGAARGNGFAPCNVHQKPVPALPRSSRFPAPRRDLGSGTPRRTAGFDGDGTLALVSLNGELAVTARAEAAERSFGVAVAASGANDIHSASAKAMSRRWSALACSPE
jgi:hypothetical protein